MRTATGLLALVGVAATASVSLADIVAYDQMTGVPNTAWLIPTSTGTPTGSGNRQMGMHVNLAGTDTQVSGFDLAVVNATGAAITGGANTILRINYWVWDTVTPGTSTTTPLFSNLAGSGSATLPLTNIATFNNNSLLFLGTGPSGGAGFPPLAGTLGGLNFAPINILDGNIGITFSWDISTDGGVTFSSPNGLTSLITGGATAPAAAVGSNAAGASPTFGYYRSVNQSALDNNGNFAQGSLRQVGNNSGVVARVYTVPAPASAALLGLGGLIAARRRR